MSSFSRFVLLISSLFTFQVVVGQGINDTIICPENVAASLSNLKYTLYKAKEIRGTGVLNETMLNQVNSITTLVMIIHGWRQSVEDEWINTMKSKYLDLGSDVATLDWRYLASQNYTQAYCVVPFLGNFTGDFIFNRTINSEYDLNHIQINGFSLGGQIAGFAGQRVQVVSGGLKIRRINGLDAAGPGYVSVDPSQRLDPSDAQFVQAIHTHNFESGYPYVYGTVDFQVGSTEQAGCGAQQNGCPKDPADWCHHERAISYFTESITSDNFTAVSCESCAAFGMGMCSGNPITIMGEHCPDTARGIKYLNTNAQSPFAKGAAGIRE